MKILKLPPYCEPEQISSSHLSKDLNIACSLAGFETEIYVPSPTRGIDDETRKKYKKIKYEEMYDGTFKIHRFSMFSEGRNSIIRAIRYMFCNIAQYIKGIRTKGIDVIWGSSTPPTQGMLCAMVKKKLSKRYKKNVPFVYNLQDIFPDSLVTAKMTKKGSLIWKIGRKIEDFTYKNADKIIVISEDFKHNIMEKGVPEEKIVIIPNWVDSEKVYPIERKDNILFSRYGLDPDKYYICYSGNIGHSQNMRMLLNTAKELKTELPDIRFVLVGEGAAKEEVTSIVANEGIDNVTVLPFQPYEDIAHVFSFGDAGLIISKPGIGNSSVPSKTWSIMAAARPVICSFDDDSALSKLIKEVGCGVTAQAEEGTEAFKKAIYELYNNKEKNAEIGALGREYLTEYLDKDKCVSMYVDTIKNVANNDKKG